MVATHVTQSVTYKMRPMSPTWARNLSRAASSRTRMPVWVSAYILHVTSNSARTLFRAELYVASTVKRSETDHSLADDRFTHDSPNRNCSYLTVFWSQPLKKTGFSPSIMPVSSPSASIA